MKAKQPRVNERSNSEYFALDKIGKSHQAGAKDEQPQLFGQALRRQNGPFKQIGESLRGYHDQTGPADKED